MKPYLLLLICFFSLSLSAQTTPDLSYEIKSITADSLTSKALDYITIGLKTDKNIPVKSTLSKSDGSFLFSAIKPGKYLVAVIALGYQTKTLTVDLTGGTLVKDLGTVLISAKTNQLKEVVVMADKPIIKQEVDRISYDLQADPESKTNNVLEMMRKVPLLSVDGDDNILLKGDANYKILINGKPSSMMERNAKDVLKSMPASTIQNIEVITSPPAKYDAEGVAGIINIITNKKVDNGYNGSVNMSHRFPAGGPGVGGSATFKQGKFGLSAFGGANTSQTPFTNNTINRTTNGINTTNLSQISGRESDNRSGYFGTELSFEIDSLNLISAQLNVNGNGFESTNYQQSLLNGQTGVMQSYDLDGLNQGSGRGADAALNYQLGFRNSKTRLLTFSYRYYGYGNDQDNSIFSSNKFNYLPADYSQFNNGGSQEQTVQIDYLHPVKKLTIEAGIKGIRRLNDSDFQFKSLNTATGQFEVDPSRSNVFNNTQDVLGAYNTYQYNLKNWGFKAGFRVEQTIIDADFISSSAHVRQEYLNLIPSVNINRKFKDMSSINLGFSQRIQRPGIYQLNPFIDRSNPNFESSGNPNLHPTVGSTFSMGYSKSKKGSFNFMLGYNHFDDLIMPVSVFDPVTFITRNSFDNTGKARLFTSNVNINYPITKKISFSFNGGLAHGRVQGIVNNILVKNEGFMYNFSSSSSYRMEKGWRLNANVNVNGPNLALQGTSNSYIGSSFSVNKDIVKDKLSLSASANNPFRKYRTNIRESFGPDFFQTSNNQTFYRSFNTSLNYKFGKLKSAIKKNSRGIRNDDVSNNAAQ
ncbi:MAG: outer membrane beta-barrel protein [Daejeonella sp.]